MFISGRLPVSTDEVASPLSHVNGDGLALKLLISTLRLGVPEQLDLAILNPDTQSLEIWYARNRDPVRLCGDGNSNSSGRSEESEEFTTQRIYITKSVVDPCVCGGVELAKPIDRPLDSERLIVGDHVQIAVCEGLHAELSICIHAKRNGRVGEIWPVFDPLFVASDEFTPHVFVGLPLGIWCRLDQIFHLC